MVISIRGNRNCVVYRMIALATMVPGEQVSQSVSEQYEMQRALLEAEGSVGQDLAAMDTAVTDGQ